MQLQAKKFFVPIIIFLPFSSHISAIWLPDLTRIFDFCRVHLHLLPKNDWFPPYKIRSRFKINNSKDYELTNILLLFLKYLGKRYNDLINTDITYRFNNRLYYLGLKIRNYPFFMFIFLDIHRNEENMCKLKMCSYNSLPDR